jgi:hypothetical protein
MASLTYKQHFADGTSRIVRRAAKQGAPTKDASLLRSCRVTIHLTSADYLRFSEQAQKFGMSESTFGDLALFYGIKELSVTDNC